MRYTCSICGYIYDEDIEGIPFDELPADYRCPLCTAPKDLFDKQETSVIEHQELFDDHQMHELSNGEIAAALSNLARGLEKQNKIKEAEDMMTLADYFTSSVKSGDASLKMLAESIDNEIAAIYPSVKDKASEMGDRGTQRIAVWGSKVTSIIKVLLDDCLHNNGSLLKGKKVFVCSVCGFIYVGDEAPKICPVCKVPDWKFEEVKGR